MDIKDYKRYFLGRMSAEDAETLELRTISSDETEGELLQAENDLIEDYLDGTLSDEDIKAFNTYFLVTKERRERVELVKKLISYAKNKKTAKALKNTKPDFFEQLKVGLNLRKFAFTFGGIALILTIGFASYLAWKSYSGYSDNSEISILLNKSFKNDRPTEARITGFDYAPKSEGTRGNGDKSPELNLVSAKSRATEAVLKNETAENFHELGRVYLAEKNFDEAVKQFEKAVKLNPNIAAVHNDLGAALMEKAGQKDDGKLELLTKANEEIEKSIELDQNLVAAYFNRGLVIESLNLPNQAKEAWENYLKLDSSSQWADEAREHLRKLEINKPVSKTKEEVLQEFEEAKQQNNENLAWQILSRNREMIENKLIPQQLALLYVNARSEGKIDESEKWLALLKYAGNLEEKNSGDLFWKDVSRFYVNIDSENKILILKQAQDSINKGFEMLRVNKWAEAGEEFSNSKKQFLIVHNIQESKIAEFWTSYPLFLNHKYTESYAVLKPVAEYADQNNYKWLSSQALGWLGINAGNSNHFSQEIEFYKKSLHFADEAGDLYNQQKFNAQTADFYLQNGQFKDSLRFAEKISRNVSAEESGTRQKLRNYDVLSRLFFSLGLNEVSINYKKEALKTWSENKSDKVFPWINFTDLAVIYGKQGKYKEAFENLETARNEANSFEGADVRIAYIDLQTAQINRISSNFKGALEFYNKAIEFYDSTEFQPHRYTAHKGKLLCLLALKDNVGFENELQTVFQILHQYRGEILEDSTRVSFFDTEQIVYDAAIDYEVEKGDYQKGLDYSEESRSRSLLDLLNRKGKLTETEQGADVKHLPDISNPLLINDIRVQLPPNLQIVQFTVLSDKVLIWIFSKDNSAFAKVDVSIDSLREDVKSYLSLISERNSDNLEEETRLSKKLYEILIKPIEDKLDKNIVVSFIPDKFLFQIPFAALISPDTNKYLISDYTIFSSPSLNVLLTCTKRSNRAASSHPERILAIGNPSFDRKLFPNLQPLESAETEAEKIADFYAHSNILVGSNATKKNVIKGFAETDVIQFAGHYLINETSPLLSGFVLSSPGEGSYKDSFLSNSEIFNLNLSNVKLIVLSACQTGNESIFDGEGPVGATRTFLAAGVPQVVASHWSVDSIATGELMAVFQQNRKERGFSTFESLRTAQLNMIETKDFNRPYFWGAFETIGGYQ